MLENNQMINKVLVTGGAGYIGSVVVNTLLSAGYKVRVLDLFIFGEESIKHHLADPNFDYIKGDIRNDTDITAAVNGVDAVIHLAAIVGAPESSRIPELTWDINFEATKKLIFASIKEKVKRFIPVSTCSNYGSSGSDVLVNELSPLTPISPYAESKVATENYILSINKDDLNWTIPRLATVYGVSPRMRFDLLVNEFTREAVLKNKLVIFGNQGRTFIHIKDVAKAFLLFLNEPLDKVNHKIFNVGSTEYSNCTKGELGHKVASVIPNTTVEVVQKDLDARDYRVSFDKITKDIGFEVNYKIEDGVREISEYLAINPDTDPYNDRYSNLNAYLKLQK